jgi:hypothetical protein
MNPLAGLAAIAAAVALGSVHSGHRSLARKNIRLFNDQSADADTCGARHFQLQLLRSSYARASAHVESLDNGPDKWALTSEVNTLRDKLLHKENAFRLECVK